MARHGGNRDGGGGGAKGVRMFLADFLFGFLLARLSGTVTSRGSAVGSGWCHVLIVLHPNDPMQIANTKLVSFLQ